MNQILTILRKPFKGTVAANVLEHGTGGINISACRIGTGEDKISGGCAGTTALHGGGIKRRSPVNYTVGRWPANLILTPVSSVQLDEQSGTLTSGKLAPHHKRNVPRFGYGGKYGNDEGYENAFGEVTSGGDSGGASRFFQTVDE